MPGPEEGIKFAKNPTEACAREIELGLYEGVRRVLLCAGKVQGFEVSWLRVIPEMSAA